MNRSGKHRKALPVLSVQSLSKRYNLRTLFHDLEFQLDLGDRLVVLGRNGCGKSTLLKIIAGLVLPDTGSVTLPAGDIRRTIALAAIDGALYSPLTGREHLELTAGLRGCEPRASELLKLVGLADAAEVPAGRMSSGMRARLRLAIAEQANPAILLLDEPSAVLDQHGRAVVEAMLERQQSRGVTVLATNDPDDRRLGNFELGLGS